MLDAISTVRSHSTRVWEPFGYKSILDADCNGHGFLHNDEWCGHSTDFTQPLLSTSAIDTSQLHDRHRDHTHHSRVYDVSCFHQHDLPRI